ncbi:MAG: hypothetical protein ACHRXM_37320 [Isosphaerales bacterium]
MDVLTRVVVWLDAAANALGKSLLAPIGILPGWLSATIVSAVTGVLLLLVYKYTSNQHAIKRVRNDINADLLAIKLFKDSTSVALRAQGRLLLSASRLFLLSIVPMLVMLVPVSLLLSQLALWYQFRPLRVGEDAVVTLNLSGRAGSSLPEVRLQPSDAMEITTGPVRVLSKRQVCWNIRARRNGHHRLVFQADDQTRDKELAISDGFMRVSTRRPGWGWSDALLHPCEEPFAPDSTIQSIEIGYPEHSSWTTGTNWWVIYWFGMSMVAALCFRSLFKVNI